VIITEKTERINNNWTDFTFNSTPTRRTVWLVVTDTTNAYTRWVSASSGGGTKSYFKNNAYYPYWQRFSDAGFACELLFGLVGHFNFGNNADLELVDFGFAGDLYPGAGVNPTFRIYNHGPDDVTDWQIELELSYPEADTSYQTISGIETIPMGTMLIIGVPGYDDYIDLPREATQMKVVANLVSQYEETGIALTNNKISKTYPVFSDTLQLHVVENFHRSGNGYPIINNTGFEQLFYYPNQADAYFTMAASERFNWYAFNTLPKVVIDGEKRFHYYDEDSYSSEFNNAISEARKYRTFISSSTCAISKDAANNETMYAQIKLFNADTQLFTTNTQNPALNSRFFAGLFNRFSDGGDQAYKIVRWLGFATVIDSTLNSGTSITKTFTFSVAGIDSTDLALNYRIYYWLQDKNGEQIFYTGKADFSNYAYSGLEDEFIPHPALIAYPNPVRKATQIKLEGLPTKAKIRVYNLKGQKIWENDPQIDVSSIPTSVFPTSGIYFIRSEIPGAKHSAKQTIKISVIK
jgi:hypothetical protein